MYLRYLSFITFLPFDYLTCVLKRNVCTVTHCQLIEISTLCSSVLHIRCLLVTAVGFSVFFVLSVVVFCCCFGVGFIFFLPPFNLVYCPREIQCLLTTSNVSQMVFTVNTFMLCLYVCMSVCMYMFVI